MRTSILLATTLFAAMSANAQAYTSEPGTYRQGGTYAIHPSTDARTCATLCGADETCKAWSFQRETSLGPAQCELKSSVGRSTTNPLMISGISPRLTGASISQVAGSDTLLGGPADNVIRARIVRSAPAKLAAPEVIAPVVQHGETIFETIAPVLLIKPDVSVQIEAASNESEIAEPETPAGLIAPAPNMKPAVADTTQNTVPPHQRLRERDRSDR